jgi:hypothetical protein
VKLSASEFVETKDVPIPKVNSKPHFERRPESGEKASTEKFQAKKTYKPKQVAEEVKEIPVK